MKHLYSLLFVLLITCVLLNCKPNDQKQDSVNAMATIEFGKNNETIDSLTFDLDIPSFKTYRDLVIRTEKLVCNDSIPTITIPNDTVIKKVHFSNPCWDDYGCILLFQRNLFQIHNDSIIKGFLRFPIDSLKTVLKKDLRNNGKDSSFSDNPDKLLVLISLDSSRINELKPVLDKTTDAYLEITGQKDIRIWLNEWIEFIPPPPPPQSEININAPQQRL